VPKGRIKLVLFDAREASSTQGELQEVYIGEDNYALVKVPPGIWNGFKGVGTEAAIVANCANIPHDPTEITRMDPLHNDVIDYDWSLKHR
jgi:dTDP-4-dehydrorhamnose 3,5-epimerase